MERIHGVVNTVIQIFLPSLYELSGARHFFQDIVAAEKALKDAEDKQKDAEKALKNLPEIDIPDVFLLNFWVLCRIIRLVNPQESAYDSKRKCDTQYQFTGFQESCRSDL